MMRQLRSALLAVIVLTVLLGLAYPLAITGVAQVLWPHQANGSRVEEHGRLVGSLLIGQDFRGDPRYFQSRPSATADIARSPRRRTSGPTPPGCRCEVRTRLDAFLRRERPYDPGLRVATVPADAVTASGSGVDPDISTANAAIQAHRVAAVSGLALAIVLRLVAEHTEALPGVCSVPPRSTCSR